MVSSQDRFNRPAGTGAISLMIPGTSCLDTIAQSLRDTDDALQFAWVDCQHVTFVPICSADLRDEERRVLGVRHFEAAHSAIPEDQTVETRLQGRARFLL